MPSQELTQAVLALISAENDLRRKRVISEHANLLLSDAADQLLGDWLSKEENPQHAQRLEECRALLRHQTTQKPPPPREKVRQALLDFVDATSAAKRKQIVLAQQEYLLTDAAAHFLADWIEAEEEIDDESDELRHLQTCQALLARCRREGIDSTFAELIRGMPVIFQIVLDFLDAKTWPESKRIVETHRAILLTDEALQIFDALLIGYKENQDFTRRIEQHRELLARCRQEGIDAAFAEVNSDLTTLIDEIDSLTHPKDMSRRLELCETLLSRIERNAQPEAWAWFQMSAATSLVKKPDSNRDENIEKAIERYNLALQIYTLDRHPKEWAMIQDNLGTAYNNRIRGERALNIERAIEHYTLALTVRTPKAFPQDWAITQNNLGQAYYNRIRGKRYENIEQAIKHFYLALVFKNPEEFPKDYPQLWSTLQNNLAIAYNDRIQGERAENLEKAIYHHQQALTVRTRQDFPYDWAITQNNLAQAYLERIRGDRATNLEQAIYHHEQALEIFTRQTFPEHWAVTINNQALVYIYRIQGEKTENLEQAIYHYKQSLEIYTPRSFPNNCRRAASFLGALLYDKKRYAEARQAFETAHKAAGQLHGQVQREAAKQKLSEENSVLYATLVHTCLLLGDQTAAFEYAVAGKGRAFVDALATGGFNISNIDNNSALASEPLLKQYLQTYKEIDQMRFTRQNEDFFPHFEQILKSALLKIEQDSDIENIIESNAHLKNKFNNIRLALKSKKPSANLKQIVDDTIRFQQEKLATLWEDLTFKYPNLTTTLAAPPLTASDAMTLAADLHATLVEYVEHAGGWSAFVVTKDTIQHVPLENVDDKLLNGVTKWIKNIEEKKRVSFGERITSKRLTQLYAALIAPLQEHLPPANQAERLVIAPFGALHQLPLNAAQNPDTLAYLSQAYALTFTPSLAALRVSLDGARQANWSFQVPENPIHVARAGHPDMTSIKPLQKADQSAAEMAKMFPNLKQLSEENATLEAAVTNVANRDLIHFYCHGIFEPDNPNQSGLLLDDGFLTVQRIITDLDLNHTHLTALAACRTGRVGVTQGEELVGLIQALLTSGSKSVVATLWKVDETPTQAFFQHFYHAIKAGHLPAEALSHATQAIRQTEGWKHPYYWAAFQVSGLAHHWGANAEKVESTHH